MDCPHLMETEYVSGLIVCSFSGSLLMTGDRGIGW